MNTELPLQFWFNREECSKYVRPICYLCQENQDTWEEMIQIHVWKPDACRLCTYYMCQNCNYSDRDTCNICMTHNDTPLYYLLCNHLYHKLCITNWLLQKNSCPICNNNII